MEWYTLVFISPHRWSEPIETVWRLLGAGLKGAPLDRGGPVVHCGCGEHSASHPALGCDHLAGGRVSDLKADGL